VTFEKSVVAFVAEDAGKASSSELGTSVTEGVLHADMATRTGNKRRKPTAWIDVFTREY
jgi:hypothetical protein